MRTYDKYQQKLIRIINSKNINYNREIDVLIKNTKDKEKISELKASKQLYCTYYQYHCLDRFIQFVSREYDFYGIMEMSLIYFSMFYTLFKNHYTDFLAKRRDSGEVPAFLIDAEIRVINSLI